MLQDFVCSISTILGTNGLIVLMCRWATNKQRNKLCSQLAPVVLLSQHSNFVLQLHLSSDVFQLKCRKRLPCLMLDVYRQTPFANHNQRRLPRTWCQYLRLLWSMTMKQPILFWDFQSLVVTMLWTLSCPPSLHEFTLALYAVYSAYCYVRFYIAGRPNQFV